MTLKFMNGEKMGKIKEFCEEFNRKWDDIPEPKRFMYFVAAAMVWSVVIATIPVLGIAIAAVALTIRFQKYAA